MKLTKDEKETAYEDAIQYLIAEECSYDVDGNYKEARLWLSRKLRKQQLKLFKTKKENFNV